MDVLNIINNNYTISNVIIYNWNIEREILQKEYKG
nr:MAG TPA: hypothetical protein [Bacteriophage sp.]